MSTTPTLKHLATKLGLSIATVSLGLRHEGGISKETCERVEKAAKEMGYQPNAHAAARRLRTAPAPGASLAIVREPMREGAPKLYPPPHILNNILLRSTELGYRCECVDLLHIRELPRLLKVLFNRGIQGIFLPAEGSEFNFEDHDWSRFSIVACGTGRNCPFDSVTQDVFNDTRFLLEEVIRRGYRNICVALCCHDPMIPDDTARLAASHFVAPPGGKPNKLFITTGDEPIGPSFADFVKKEKIDAVVGFHPGFCLVLEGAGIKVPQDVAFASMIVSAEDRISGLRPLFDSMGDAAANHMDTLIRHHERGIPAIVEQITIRAEWHKGDTLPFRKKG